MSAPLPPPTPEMRRLVQLLGADMALRVVEQHGGTRIFIPKEPTPRMVEIAGGPGAVALCAAFGGENIKVPLARAWRVLIYKARGESYPTIARKVGCTEGGVWRILSEHELTVSQLDMFAR